MIVFFGILIVVMMMVFAIGQLIMTEKQQKLHLFLLKNHLHADYLSFDKNIAIDESRQQVVLFYNNEYHLLDKKDIVGVESMTATSPASWDYQIALHLKNQPKPVQASFGRGVQERDMWFARLVVFVN